MPNEPDDLRHLLRDLALQVSKTTLNVDTIATQQGQMLRDNDRRDTHIEETYEEIKRLTAETKELRQDMFRFWTEHLREGHGEQS